MSVWDQYDAPFGKPAAEFPRPLTLDEVWAIGFSEIDESQASKNVANLAAAAVADAFDFRLGAGSFKGYLGALSRVFQEFSFAAVERALRGADRIELRFVHPPAPMEVRAVLTEIEHALFAERRRAMCLWAHLTLVDRLGAPPRDEAFMQAYHDCDSEAAVRRAMDLIHA